MNRCLVNLAPYIALVMIAAVITGCTNIMPLSVKVQNADRKFEQAQSMNIRADTPENKKADIAKRKELYDTALAGYLEIINQDPTGKYAHYSHFQAAAIYKKTF
jgi:hypothetical protein